mgnify:CR=1 FL=1
MNIKYFILLLVCTLYMTSCSIKKQQVKHIDTPITAATYLGQKPPGMTPELFAPDIIKTAHREAEAAI